MGLSVMTAGFRIALLLIIILHFSSAFDGKRQSDSNAAPKVVKRATNGNLDQGRLIPGDVPIWIRTADDRSNSGSLITAPAPALHLTAGDIYAPSIMVAGHLGALSLQLGQNCRISGERFIQTHCPIINETDISITFFDESIDIHTLYFSIMIDGGFKDRMMVTFKHFHPREYNISGYLYFDAGSDSCTQSPPTNDNIVNTQCDCSTTGNSDPTWPTDTPCQEVIAMLISGSTLNHLNFPWAGSVFIVVVVSMLLSAT